MLKGVILCLANTKFMPVVSEKKLETTETRIALALPTGTVMSE